MAYKVLVTELKISVEVPSNPPAPLLNCSEFVGPPEVPLLALMQVPLMLKQPPERSTPPANVEVPVDVLSKVPVKVPPPSGKYASTGISDAVRPEIPCTVALLIDTPLKLSMRCVSARLLLSPPELGVPKRLNSVRNILSFVLRSSSEIPPGAVT